MSDPFPSKPSYPLVLRLAGLWLIWSAWASATGWLLSAAGRLNAVGYFFDLPILLLAAWFWWQRGRTKAACRFHFKSPRRRRVLPLCFAVIAILSLASGLSTVPWSFDAVTYRLPRCLYWLAENRWHWIGTIDGRLDYSACGLEWQMIPTLLLTRGDRLLFLLAWIPFLLLPGLTYLAGRALAVSRKALTLWMWLIPAAYCIALQCSGLCNDGYSATYTAASLAFAGVAIRRRDPVACAFCGIAAALLTGAKLSNLPLMLPLGIAFLVAAGKSQFFKRPAVATLAVMALVSFLPLAILSLKHTGDWTGDPNDQWGFRTGNPIAAASANLLLLSNDLVRPPLLAGTASINAFVGRIESTIPALMDWMEKSHHMFKGLSFGDMVYEGDAGPGFSIGLFLIAGTVAGLFMKIPTRRGVALPWQTAVILLGVCAWLVMLAKLGSNHTPRNAAPYLPFLIFTCCLLPPLRKFMGSAAARPLAFLSMTSVIPIIILTPARPLMPLSLLEKASSIGPVAAVLGKYRIWQGFRDDLKPMRDHLPADQKVIGYAGAFRDTSYGLWKPLGGRTLPEIGIPIKSQTPRAAVPPYVVATEPGVRQRFGVSLAEWSSREKKEIRYTFNRAMSLDADGDQSQDRWYLLGPAAAPLSTNTP